MKIKNLCLFVVILLPFLPALAQSSAPPNDQPPAAAAEPAPPSSQVPDAIPALPAGEPKDGPVTDEQRLVRKVRHALVMQPTYSVWDWLTFRVNGNTVELLGDVYNGGLKRAAISAVKEIEGVEVIDHIHLLPPSPVDDRIRHQVSDAIYSSGSLSSYAWSAQPSIHIIVTAAQVRLEGVVDNQSDKDAAALRAHEVPGVSQVTNNLRIEQD